MSKIYILELTEAEDIALSTQVFDQDEWIQNAIHERCRSIMELLLKDMVIKFIESGEPIPTSKEEIIISAKEKGWIVPAKELSQKGLGTTP